MSIQLADQGRQQKFSALTMSKNIEDTQYRDVGSLKVMGKLAALFAQILAQRVGIVGTGRIGFPYRQLLRDTVDIGTRENHSRRIFATPIQRVLGAGQIRGNEGRRLRSEERRGGKGWVSTCRSRR